MHLSTHRSSHLAQSLAQSPVCADTASNHQTLQASFAQGPLAFDRQRFHHGVLERIGNISAIFRCRLQRPPCGDCGGFQAAKAEITAGPVGHRPGKAETSRRALLSQFRQCRPTRIRQAEQLGGLIERLARSIVHGFAHDTILTNAVYPYQQGMTTGHQQRHERKRWRVRLQHGRQQVTFHMMHADGRHAPGPGQAAANRRTDQQRANQPRTTGIGDAIDRARRNACSTEDLVQQRQGFAYMIARGQFRHDAAILGVQRDLAVQGVREQATITVIEGDAGFVAGSFKAQDQHDGPRFCIWRQG